MKDIRIKFIKEESYTLKKLLTEGLLELNEAPYKNKKMYRITEIGRERLRMEVNRKKDGKVC